MSLVHAEYLKVSRRKMYPIMVGILVFLMGFFDILFFVLLPNIPDAFGDAGVGDLPQRPEAFIFGAQQVAGQAWWFAVILATAILGGELASTIWATSLTRDSRMSIHIGARFLVFTIASTIAFLLGTLTWAVVIYAFADGSGGLSIGEWLSLIWKFGAIAAGWTALGLGAVGLSRSIAVGMGAVLGFAFADSLIAPFVDAYEQISLSAASNGIFEVGGDLPFSGFIPGAGMSTFHALAVIAGWAIVGLLLTYWGLQRRDA